MPYAEGIGWKGSDTSEQAALSVSKTAHNQRLRVLAAMRQNGGPMTAHDISAITGDDVMSVRPRLTELRDRALIFDTGQRGPTPLGSTAIRWQIISRK